MTPSDLPGSGAATSTPQHDVSELLAAFVSLQGNNARVVRLVADDLGIGATDIRAVVFCGRVATPTPGQLGDYLEISTGAVTGLIDRLERAGLMQRIPHPDDRRSVLVKLTAQGDAANTRIYDLYRQAFRAVVGPDEVAPLARSLRALGDSLLGTAEGLDEV